VLLYLSLTLLTLPGMFAFVRLFDEADSRLMGEITHVITGPEMKAWRRSGEW
jgi:hypothetical protein